MYKIIKNLRGNEVGVFIERDGFVYSIPFDPANTDYQAYLKWLEEGNEPLPADDNTNQGGV